MPRIGSPCFLLNRLRILRVYSFQSGGRSVFCIGVTRRSFCSCFMVGYPLLRGIPALCASVGTVNGLVRLGSARAARVI